MCRAISIVRSGGMGYLRTSKYFSVLRANSGEVREGYTPFFKAGSKCAFRKKNSYPVSLRITCGELHNYVVGSISFWPDIQRPRQMQNALRDI